MQMKTNTIIQGDCLKELKKLPEKSINMWLSGIIDGEGCLSIRFDKQRTSINPAVKVEITISNTNKKLLDIIQKLLGYGSINKRTSYDDNRKDSWVLRIPTSKTRLLLPNLFLIVKEKQKKVLMEALSLLGKTNPPKKRSEKIEKRLIELKKELHILNKRGKK